jgi:poly(3-hydroxybutyrate) depolymerase
MRTPFMALAAAILAAWAPSAFAQERPSEHRLRASGADRSYLLAVPATSGPAPLVIALHGGGGNAGTRRLGVVPPGCSRRS